MRLCVRPWVRGGWAWQAYAFGTSPMLQSFDYQASATVPKALQNYTLTNTELLMALTPEVSSPGEYVRG